jgi:dienelactone hydrolase
MKTLSVFVVAALAASAAALPVSAWSQTAPQQVTIKTDNGTGLRAFQYTLGTSGKLRPAVVMMHGCAGVYSYSQPNAGYTNVQVIYKDWANMLASQGYVVLLVDSFSNRLTSAGVPAAQDQCGNGAGGVSEVADRPGDALAAYDYLISQPALNVDSQRVGLLGWSHGASSVMATLASTQVRQPFRGAVAFYPGCGLYSGFGGISSSTYQPYAPLKILHGEADSLYTVGYCQMRQQRAWQLGGVQFQTMEHYYGARHSFDGCKALSASCSEADVAARTKGDAATLNFFTDLFQ